MSSAIVPRPLHYTCVLRFKYTDHETDGNCTVARVCTTTREISSKHHATEKECIDSMWLEFLREFLRTSMITSKDLAVIRKYFGDHARERVRRGDFYNALYKKPMNRERLASFLQEYFANKPIVYQILYLYYNPAEDWYVNATMEDEDGQASWASKEDAECAIRRTEDPTR